MPDSHSLTARTEFQRGLWASIPVLFGFIPFALLLGTQAAQKGLSAIEVSLMTGLNFAGGSEFAAISLWDIVPPVLLIVAMSCLVNSRHILMGAAFASYLSNLPKRKALPALFLMCDESWAIAINDAKQRISSTISLPYYLGVSTGLYLGWILFTTMGAMVGPVLGDVDRLGLDMAFVAVFLILLKGMWTTTKAAMPWLTSLIVAAFTSFYFSGTWYVAAGTISGLITAAFMEDASD